MAGRRGICLRRIDGGILGRVIDYLDALLAGKYTHHVSVRVMEHAASLDLMAYEDPVFYDRLERARVQATDRLYMIQAIGTPDPAGDYDDHVVDLDHGVFALAAAAADRGRDSGVSWARLILRFWDTRRISARLPIRRQLDYLRILGGSKEAAKELKLFGLKDFLTGRFKRLSNSGL